MRPGILKKNISTQQSTWMETEDGCGLVVLLEIAAAQRRWEVTLGGGLRLQQWCWAAMAAEKHATMVLASALSKLRAYIMMLASVLSRTASEDISDARDVHWQQWQQDRHIAAAVAVAAVQI